MPKIIFDSVKLNLDDGFYNIEGQEFTVKELVSSIYKRFEKTYSDKIFGKAERNDTSMKVLKIDGSKLNNIIKMNLTLLDSALKKYD